MTATYVAVVAGEQLVLKVGDGAEPEVFTAKSTINASRSVTLSAESTATKVPRTDDPSAPRKTIRKVTSVDWGVEGAGLLDASEDKFFADWLLSGLPKNIQVYNAKTGAMKLAGSAILSSYQVTGAGQGETVEASIKLDGADLPVVTAYA